MADYTAYIDMRVREARNQGLMFSLPAIVVGVLGAIIGVLAFVNAKPAGYDALKARVSEMQTRVERAEKTAGDLKRLTNGELPFNVLRVGGKLDNNVLITPFGLCVNDPSEHERISLLNINGLTMISISDAEGKRRLTLGRVEIVTKKTGDETSLGEGNIVVFSPTGEVMDRWPYVSKFGH